MSLNAAAIAIMVERGLTAADILAVAEALETKRDRTGAERQAKYRARRDVTANEWESIRHQVFERDGHVCTYCGSDDRIACDHIIPLAQGGKSELANLTTSCKSCNSGKGGRTADAWKAAVAPPKSRRDSHSDKVSPLQVSPQTPLPKTPSNISPLNPPNPKIDLPDWWPMDTWADFKAMRRKMRNVPFEIGAERRIVAKVTKLRAEGHDPEKLLSKAVERGYRSVFEGEDTVAARPKTEQSPAALRDMAEFYDKIGRRDSADECRQKAAALETRAA